MSGCCAADAGERRLRPPEMPVASLLERRGQFLIDVAHGHVLEGDDRPAVALLLQADHIAPQEVRLSPEVQAMKVRSSEWRSSWSHCHSRLPVPRWRARRPEPARQPDSRSSRASPGSIAPLAVGQPSAVSGAPAEERTGSFVPGISIS